MESGCGGLNDEYGFQDLAKVVRKLECACILWKGENYIHQTKHDGICE